MGNSFKKIKWIKFSLSFSLYKAFKEKVESEGFSLTNASQLLVVKYLNGDFDIEG